MFKTFIFIILHSQGGYQHFPMYWFIITTLNQNSMSQEWQAISRQQEPQTSILKLIFFFFFLKKLLQRLEAIRPTRSLSRDSLLKDHLKQKQYSKTASRSRPSSAKSTSSSVSHFSRSPSESSLMIGDSLSVASSRISSGSRRSAKGRKISRPVWESGWQFCTCSKQ